MTRPKLPNWPAPMLVAKGRKPERDMVNLSTLDTEAKRRAFQKMRQHEPGVAEFLAQMARSFGPSTTFIDTDTAKRLGVKDA